MFHILSHNGDGRQISLGKSLAHLAHLYFVGEFIIKNGDSLIGIGITHGDRSIVSEAACDTRNTLIPDCANALKIRWLTPITPTIPNPETVIRQVSFIDDIPLMALPSEAWVASVISVPGTSGLNVFL